MEHIELDYQYKKSKSATFQNASTISNQIIGSFWYYIKYIWIM